MHYLTIFFPCLNGCSSKKVGLESYRFRVQAPGWQHGQDVNWVPPEEDDTDVVSTILQIALPIVGLILLVGAWKLERNRREKVEQEQRYKKIGTCTYPMSFTKPPPNQHGPSTVRSPSRSSVPQRKRSCEFGTGSHTPSGSPQRASRLFEGFENVAGDLPKPPIPPPPDFGQPGSDSNPGPSKGASYTSSSQSARGSKSKIKVTSMPAPPTNRCDRIIHNIREQLHKTQDLDEMDRKEIIRALMLRWHPDKQRTTDLEEAGDEEHSNEVFQYIQNAKKWYM